jgi:hypothetical protein
MQKWLKKLLGQKLMDTLAFNQSGDVAQNLHLHTLPSSRATFILLASIIGHNHTKQQVQLRKKHQSKENFKRTH